MTMRSEESRREAQRRGFGHPTAQLDPRDAFAVQEFDQSRMMVAVRSRVKRTIRSRNQE
jgi:hypothetical protein